ncbi:MAG: hypothetical protein KDB27_21935 [Planctomycetales bacterium]|nr:hypothetical protein [Planctomycetales bacterium]
MNTLTITSCTSLRRLPLPVILLMVTGLADAEIVIGQESPETAGVSPQPASVTPDKLSALLLQLDSDDFSVREQASETLGQLSDADVLRLARESSEQPSAEVILRLLKEVERRYALITSDDTANTTDVSDMLEALAGTTRLILADGASHSLEEHWRTRIDLAVRDLRQCGATVKMGAFAAASQIWGAPDSGAAVQVLLDKDWSGGDRGLDVFRRLSVLTFPFSRNTLSGGLHVYLLDGHPLSPEQKAALAEYVGQNRIAERSRAALGIKPSAILQTGIQIGQVTKGSSADGAGLAAGDLIIGIKAPAREGQEDADREYIRLRDFDELVEHLRAYDAGEVMTLHIIRGLKFGFQPGERPTTEFLDVKLKGWKDMDVIQ